MKSISARPGYIFLLSVLVAGAIVGATAVTMLLLSLAGRQSSLAIEDSLHAFSYAQSCAERALRSLRADLSYIGGETVTIGDGSCVIRVTGGHGNDRRTICVEGLKGDTVRRIDILVSRVHPTTDIESWSEVSVSTLCP